MMDFIKVFPSVTIHQYMWEMTVPQIKLAMNDFTRVEYLTEEKQERGKVYDNPDDFIKELNIPTF